MKTIPQRPTPLTIPPILDPDELESAIYALNVAIGLEPRPRDHYGRNQRRRGDALLDKLGGLEEVKRWTT